MRTSLETCSMSSADTEVEFYTEDESIISVPDKSSSHMKALEQIKSAMHIYFEYNFDETDFKFFYNLYTNMKEIEDSWNRIGFDDETKLMRRNDFYKELNSTLKIAKKGEDDQENKIRKKTNEKIEEINNLYKELKLENKNSPKFPVNGMTYLQEHSILNQEIERLKGQKRMRINEYEKILEKKLILNKKLGLNEIQKKYTVPTKDEIEELKQTVISLEKLYDDRKKDMTKLRQEITEVVKDVGLSYDDTLAEIILNVSIDDMTLSESFMNDAEELKINLERREFEVSDQIKDLRIKIKQISYRLNENNLNIVIEDIPEMENQNRYHLLDHLNKEYNKCLGVRMENISKLLESTRKEIKDHCSKIFMSAEEIQKDYGDLFDQTEYTEELLKQHEEKLDDLKFNFEEFSILYEKTSKWIQLWNDFLEFEEKTKDPLRFKTRGHNMLEEEKQRKNFNNQLPRLEEELTNLAEEYQKTNGGNEFKIMGLYYLEYINRKKYDHEQSKQNERKEKQILRETTNKRESKYGSKPVTPLSKSKKNPNETGSSSKNSSKDSKSASAKKFNTSKSSINNDKAKKKSSLIANKRMSRGADSNKRRSIQNIADSILRAQINNQEKQLQANHQISSSSSLISNQSKVGSSQSNKKEKSILKPINSASNSGSKLVRFQRVTSTASNSILDSPASSNIVNPEKGLIEKAVGKLSKLADSTDDGYTQFKRELSSQPKFTQQLGNRMSRLNGNSGSNSPIQKK